MLLNHSFATKHTQLSSFLSHLPNHCSLAILLERWQALCFTGSYRKICRGKAEKKQVLELSVFIFFVLSLGCWNNDSRRGLAQLGTDLLDNMTESGFQKQ